MGTSVETVDCWNIVRRDDGSHYAKLSMGNDNIYVDVEDGRLTVECAMPSRSMVVPVKVIRRLFELDKE